MGNSVGKASIVLTADTAQMSKGLDKAAKEAKQKGEKVRGALSDKLKDISGGEQSGIGGVLGGFGKAGIAGAVIASIATIGKEIFLAANNARVFERELEKGQLVLDQWAERADDKISHIKESLSEFDGVAGTSEGLKAFGSSVRTLESDLAATNVALAKAESARADWDSKWNSTTAFRKWVKGELEDTAKDADESAKKIRGIAERQRKAAEELAKQNARLLNPLTNPEAKKALRDIIKGFQDDVKNLNRNADDAKLDDLKDRFGFKEADLGAARMAMLAKNVANADEFIKELKRDADDLAKGIERNAEDAKIDEFQKLGIGKAQIDQMRRLNELKKQANQTRPEIRGLLRGSADELKFQRDLRFNQEKAKGQQQEKLLGDVVQKLVQINLSIMGLKMEPATI